MMVGSEKVLDILNIIELPSSNLIIFCNFSKYIYPLNHRKSKSDFIEIFMSDDFVKSIPGVKCEMRLGKGHFSHVYKGSYEGHSPVTIKIIERGGAHEIQREIDLLKRIKGCPNTINLVDTFLHQGHTVLIIDFVEAISLNRFYKKVQIKNMQNILHDLFETLNAVHARQVVHRDITANNVLIHPKFNKACLIDWGCGSIVSSRMRPNAGTRPFRSPEMLMNSISYDTSCDIWSAGIYIWSILCGMTVPWRAKTADQTLINISEYFGADELLQLSEKISRPIAGSIQAQFSQSPTKTLEQDFISKMGRLQHPLLIDLMKSLLKIDPDERPTAEEVLNHPFFSEKL
ncbi:Casein kinase II subunit alpha [Tritrichomonas foetus]|uniref:non-specific serine/threonine protein kinase n=1 Tax=Tritrichomonas foetus TaxID=1144522 RepID=A0A1J4JQX3_9EUKA|nr:Casein kinase II subunit alpha [Tritrichomonas foetus]|eukprot:OHS99917.1 Casein kinase II subunit alpha [Tritrichomonas foetus]